MNEANPDNINYDQKYVASHTYGKASEDFDLVICAMHKPASDFVQGEASKLIIRGSQNQYIVELNPFTATNDPACGTLEAIVSFNDNGKHNPTSDTNLYV